jgi:hypothetical protein
MNLFKNFLQATTNDKKDVRIRERENTSEREEERK